MNEVFSNFADDDVAQGQTNYTMFNDLDLVSRSQMCQKLNLQNVFLDVV